MITIGLSNLRLVLGGRRIFDGLNWNIQHDQKIGLIGPNGAGKSSLFKLITGEYTAEAGGSVTRARGVTTGYLPQQPETFSGQTALQAALEGNPRWAEIQQALADVELRMGLPEVYNNSKALARALDEQQRLLEEFQALDGDTYPARVHQILHGLGLETQDFDQPVELLSGGQKKLVGLARLLLLRPALLLLDEPDNHLDLAGKAFLEKMIREYPGAVVIISHDRYLLDAAVTHIAELEDGKLTTFTGDYTAYTDDKLLRLARQEELFRIQQREVSRLETAIKRYSIWAKVYDNEKFAIRARAIQNRLDKMPRIEKPVTERRRIDLELSGWRGSNKVLEIKNLQKSYPGQPVLTGVNLLLRHGDRAGLIGANGAGKSVLLRLVLGLEEADAGEIVTGPSVRTGYYAQEHETLDPEMTLIDTVRRGIPAGGSMSEANAVSFLNRYLFSYRQASQKVKELSGGERSRLQMALLVLSGANFLLLDEPTNNLDIASAEVLEAALADFIGTVLVISHDRYFLDRVVERLFVLEDGLLKEFAGGYSDYLNTGGGKISPAGFA
jgi:ATP-binding cassette subfamily F protein 3